MQLFLSGITPSIAKEYCDKSKGISKDGKPEKLDILISFYTTLGKTYDITQTFRPYVNDIILDSGAFSIFNKPFEREHIQNRFEMYLKYTLRNYNFYNDGIRNYFYKFIMAYDKYAESDKFDDNYQLYIKMNIYKSKLTPVIHDINFLSNEIDIYANSKPKPEYIAIGKLAQDKNKNNLEPLIKKVHDYGIKCHVLGVSDYDILSSLEFEACDSTSWFQYAKYGLVFYFAVDNNNQPIIDTVEYQEVENRPFDRKYTKIDNFTYKKEFYEDMKKLGIEEKDFRNPKRLKSRMFANIYYTRRMVDYINKQRQTSVTPASLPPTQ